VFSLSFYKAKLSGQSVSRKTFSVEPFEKQRAFFFVFDTRDFGENEFLKSLPRSDNQENTNFALVFRRTIHAHLKVKEQ
jgi:hypothetical protein